MLDIVHQTWMLRANCASVPLQVFFPPTDRGIYANWAEARRICAGCEVQVECLRWCLSFEQPGKRHGMFGGTTPKERTLSWRATHRRRQIAS